MRSIHAFWVICLTGWVSLASQQTHAQVRPGAERLNQYLPLLEGKRVGLFANQTSRIGEKHLVDALLENGVKVTVIFGPEHGFRGKADAGEKVGNSIDDQTGIPIISLYGSKRRPDQKDLNEVDILLFDIQDVGVRFYTFISSLEEFMLSAIEFKKPLIVLDRPNPNGHYVDGPVLDTRYRSFVGRQPVPIVYGLTIGEYATLLLGENWIDLEKIRSNAPAIAPASITPMAQEGDAGKVSDGQKVSLYVDDINTTEIQLENDQFKLVVITCENYDHQTRYPLPVKPSPNLPTIQSIYLYPFTCLFEGTALSEGRGTDKPFQVFGHPDLPKTLFAFTPNPNDGAKSSKHYGKKCYGWDLSGTPEQVYKLVNGRVQLKWLLQAYQQFPKKDSFFLLPKSDKMEESFFTKLAGNNELWQQIKKGMSEAQIRATWEPKLTQYKATRKKYLLYKDFE